MDDIPAFVLPKVPGNVCAVQFEDLFPFKDQPAKSPRDDLIVPSAQSSSDTETRPSPSALAGRSGIYRAAFTAMEVPGLDKEVRIGSATIVQTTGPIWTQRTTICQAPGWRPVYLKTMEYVPIAAGRWLTVCQLPVMAPPDLDQALTAWRSRALSLTALLATVLDERVAQELVVEDVLIYDEHARDVVAVVDGVRNVRIFQSANRLSARDRATLETLGWRIADQDDSPLMTASRWYLRAAQLGPAPDAIVFLWIALEALAKPAHRTKLSGADKRLTDVAWVERAIVEAGRDPSRLTPSVGRLAGLRAEIVHGGIEDPVMLREGYYVLEQLVRLLIRHRLGTTRLGWPLSPARSGRRPPLRLLAEVFHRRPRTRWTQDS